MIAKNLKKFQCPKCIKVLCGKNSMLRHLITVHRCTMEELDDLYYRYKLE